MLKNEIPIRNSFINDSDGVHVGRGCCLIINQIFLNDPIRRRKGSEIDEAELVKTWEYLGCKNNVIVERNLNENEMMIALKKFQQRLVTLSPDFMVLVILGHGT